ncbi:MAG TPA: MFS transporter [Dehalococcoidia bacterium]|nr:MFS transporter [Dehalococcoidia bacterium]
MNSERQSGLAHTLESMGSRRWHVALARDGWLLIGARAFRLFGSGLVSVILAVYLAALGLPPATIGVVFTATLAGTAALTVAVAAIGDRVGRRRLLMLMGLLMLLAGVVFALTDALWLFMLAGFLGVITPGGGEVGSSLALEQAALAQVIPPVKRTSVYAWANLFASAAASPSAPSPPARCRLPNTRDSAVCPRTASLSGSMPPWALQSF